MIDATAATMTLTILRSVLSNGAVQFWLSFVCFTVGSVSVQLQYSWIQRWFSLVQLWLSIGSVIVQLWEE